MKRILIPVLLFAAFFSGIWTGRFYQPSDTGIEVPVLDRDYYTEVLSLIKSAKSSVHILMFEIFYYPEYPESKTNLLLNELVNAQSRGLDVKVCMEGGEDYLGEEFWLKQLRAYGYLEDNGVEVRVDPKGITSHAKLLIVDSKTVILGSTNWSFYALEKNSETNILMESNSLAFSFESYFDRIWKSSSPLNLEDTLERSLELERQSPIAKLLMNPDDWDGERVRIYGEVINLKKRRSRSGNLYSTFYLSDKGGHRVKIFKWGHPKIDNGEHIEVEGVFRKEKRVGKLKFYNELEAEIIIPK